MKTLLGIIPEERQSLLVIGEIGWYGATIGWFEKNGTLAGAASYSFDQESEDERTKRLISSLEEYFVHTTYKHLFYNFQETLMIPTPYHRQEFTASMLECIYGYIPGSKAVTEEVSDRVIISFVPEALHKMVNESAIPWMHSNICLQKFPEGITCIFYHSVFKLVLIENGSVLFTRQYEYQTPQDAAYHILNTCRQYNVLPAEKTLNLMGLIDENSPLFSELKNHFDRSDLFTKHSPVVGSLLSYPQYYFSHLMLLSECVS